MVAISAALVGTVPWGLRLKFPALPRSTAPTLLMSLCPVHQVMFARRGLPTLQLALVDFIVLKNLM